MLKLVSFHIQAHLNQFLQILEYLSQICLRPLARESPCILCTVNTQHTSRQDAIITIRLHLPTCFGRKPFTDETRSQIQGVYKRMVRFQKLTRNLFLTLHGQNVHRQQRQLSKFLMRYQQFTSHA